MRVDGIVFEVREFCLHDGPGIRTTVFFKGCPLRCAWCHNPEGLTPEPELLVNRAACTGCGACEKACPLGGSAQRRPNGADTPDSSRAFQPADCTACGACVAVCPQGCRRVCGRRVSAESLADELRRNEAFFLQYNGGVTFSGGEPLMQAAFAVSLATRLRPVHVAVETSGYASPERYRDVVQAVDLVIQDLKHPDAEEHRRYTGVDPAPIWTNLAWLKASGKPFIARIPLIPGVNDAPETLAGFADLLVGPSGLTGVELLPYHLTAGAKYALVGLEYAPPFDPDRPLNADPAPFIARGLPCRVM